MLSDLEFGSFLVYPPKGVEEPGAEAARNFVLRNLKQDRRRRSDGLTGSQIVAGGLHSQLGSDDSLIEFISADAVLVPVPRRARHVEGGLWPSLRIAEALVEAGFGSSCSPVLERRHAVPKSAFAATAAERPTPRVHYDSLVAHQLVAHPIRFLLVDDVITRGATLLGCASRLSDAYPGVDIRAFAVARTLRSSFPGLVDPVVGVVLGGEDWVRREP